MEFKTKYSLGDTVWMMHDNKPKSFQIHEISIVTWLEPGDYYSLNTLNKVIYSTGGSDRISFSEKDVCDSKEELIKSLMEKP